MNFETVQLPDKDSCLECGKQGSPEKSLRRCAKCRAAAYFPSNGTYPFTFNGNVLHLLESQRANWKSHKLSCVSFATEKNLNSTGVYMGQSAPKVKKGTIPRTRLLRSTQKGHPTGPGYLCTRAQRRTFTVSAWNLLGLIKDISRAKTHILALTLHRTTSINPRTLYDLVDSEVIAMTVMDELYADRRSMVDSSPFSIREMLESDALRREPHGALGSVMVITTELPHGDDRSPRQALTNVNVSNFHPLGLFEVHKNSLGFFASFPREFFIRCLRNGLKGGAYAPTFKPYTPMP